jgi:hypothetical protein
VRKCSRVAIVGNSLLFKWCRQFQLDTIRVAETENGDTEWRQISNFSVLYAMLLEESSSFFEFGTIGNTEAEVIEPYTIGAEIVIWDGFACIPRWRNAQEHVAIGHDISWWQFRGQLKVEQAGVEGQGTGRVGDDESHVVDACGGDLG